jgi:hypothetical protein
MKASSEPRALGAEEQDDTARTKTGTKENRSGKGGLARKKKTTPGKMKIRVGASGLRQENQLQRPGGALSEEEIRQGHAPLAMKARAENMGPAGAGRTNHRRPAPSVRSRKNEAAAAAAAMASAGTKQNRGEQDTEHQNETHAGGTCAAQPGIGETMAS